MRARPRKNAVVLVRWTRRPGQDPLIKLVLFSILGLILCLVLMVFLPGLRSVGAVAIFTAVFAVILTAPTVASRRRFMQGLIRRINDTIGEVTGIPGNHLSVRQLRRLAGGEHLPVTVSGVPGLSLRVDRSPAVESSAPTKLSAVLTMTSPDDGTASFDRLMAAAIGPGSTTAAPDPS